MIQRKLLKAVYGFALVGSMLVSCQDIAEDDHYASPSWLKGNAWQVMENEGGNYSSFLRAIELTGFKPIVDGKSVMTVIAADNDAWQKYLSQEGYESVDDMWQRNPKQLKKTVGFHIMYYAYDWSKMVNFRPNEGDLATEDDRNKNAGMWYKHRTHSQDDMEQMRGKFDARDTTVTVYHYERFLPVLSHRFFETQGLDAKSNYEYFYPNSEWTGGSNGFNVSNASVIDTEATVTDNGYLYHVNQVVTPLETIYQTLKNNSNYSDYISLYDKYAEFSEADNQTINNVGYKVYMLTHGELPNIACEWPVNDYKAMNVLESEGYSIFAPSNQAISKFFTNYWTEEGGYGNIDQLDPLLMRYFIMQSFSNSNRIVFPEQISKGLVKTMSGTSIDIDPQEVDDRMICENGVVYGMNDMEAPAIFSCVIGPAFADTTYQCYLYTLDKSELVLSLASDKTEFVTLIPTNLQYNQNEPQMRLNTTSAGKMLEVSSDEIAAFANMGKGTAQGIVNIHTAPNINTLPATGIQVVETNEPFNYWFVLDGKITTNARFNEQLSPEYAGTPFVDFNEVKMNGGPWSNGKAYTYASDDLFKAASGDGLTHRLAICNDKNFEYYLFSQLLQKAGLVSGGDLPSLVSEGNRLIVFAPTNEVIKQNISKIPGCGSLKIADDYTLSGTVSTANKILLANYLRNYFISSLMNTVTSYPYPGSSCKGRFMAMSGEYVNITSDSSMSVGLENGTPVALSDKFHCLPFAFADGCLQFINGIME